MAHSDHDASEHVHKHSNPHDSRRTDCDPEFEITLTSEQLSELARFAATWSQIEFLILNVIAVVAKGDSDKSGAHLDGMGIDARISHLRNLIPHLPNEQAKNQATSLCDRLNEIIPCRNHVMHGIWGLFVDRKEMKALPACFYGRSRERPIFASELSTITRAAADVSRRLGALLGLLTPAFVAGSPPRRFFFSDGPPPAGPPPDWP